MPMVQYNKSIHRLSNSHQWQYNHQPSIRFSKKLDPALSRIRTSTVTILIGVTFWRSPILIPLSLSFPSAQRTKSFWNPVLLRIIVLAYIKLDHEAKRSYLLATETCPIRIYLYTFLKISYNPGYHHLAIYRCLF